MLEVRLLDAHLERCPSCARVAADIGAITTELRAAPLERPSTPTLVPRQRRRRAFGRVDGVRTVGRLAAVAVGGLLAFTIGSQSADVSVGTATPSPIVIDAVDLASVDAEPTEFRAYRRAALLDATAASPAVGKHPGSQPM